MPQDGKENRWRSLLETTFERASAVGDARGEAGTRALSLFLSMRPAIIFSVSWENADLLGRSVLASQGYVVLASPSMGVSTRDLTDDLDGINAQAGNFVFFHG